MNLKLRADVDKLLETKHEIPTQAQALCDLWWFTYHGQPHDLTELLEAVIRNFQIKEVERDLESYTRQTRLDRARQQVWLPFESDRDRDEWVTEEVRDQGTHPGSRSDRVPTR